MKNVYKKKPSVCCYCKTETNSGIFFNGKNGFEKFRCFKSECNRKGKIEEKEEEKRITTEMIRANRCPFIIAWRGRCGEKGDPFCEKHKDVYCSCGKKAIKECSFAGSFLVCGKPLCEDCQHQH